MPSGIRPPYSQGTISVENDATTATGTVTGWIGQALAGCPIVMPDGRLYVITADAESNTSLSFFPAYAGATVSESADYFILRFTERMAAAAEQTDRLRDYLDRHATILSGTAVPDANLGGTGSLYYRRDGTQIIEIYVRGESGWSDPLSFEITPALQALADQIAADASSAAASAGTALTHRNTAQGHATTASGHKDAAQSAAAAAGASADEAATSASAAATSASAAAASASASATSATSAANSATAAAASAGAASGSASTAAAQASAAAGSATAAAASAAAAADYLSDAAALRKLTATSASSVEVGTGEKIFTLDDDDVQYIGGERVRVVSDATPSLWMSGVVTSLSGDVLTLDIDVIGAVGTAADWKIALTGERGLPGTGSVDSVNGQPGPSVTLTASDIEVPGATPGYTPAGSSVADHLAAIGDALGGGADYAETTIASAATVNIGGAATTTVVITGTTTITNFDNVPNTLRVLRFSAGLTVNVTGIVQFTVVAGDIAIVISDGAGAWRLASLQRAFALGVITPATITANQNNYNPANLATAAVLRLATDASRNITGLAGGVGGRLIVVHNVGSHPIVLINESASSTAANRLALLENLTLAAGASVTLIYDGTSSRWRLSTPTGGAFDVSVTKLTSGSGTYTRPAGVRALYVKGVAGGGAGGGVDDQTANAVSGGTGGGGGGFELWISNAYLESSYSYAIGAGGAGASAAAGGDGGNTTFSGANVSVTANGGNGGPVGTTGSGTVAGGDGGSTSITGALATAGFVLATPGLKGGPNIPSNGMFAASGGSLFGSGVAHNNGNGLHAAAPGAGGGSSHTIAGVTANRTGGNGASGLIIITEYY